MESLKFFIPLILNPSGRTVALRSNQPLNRCEYQGIFPVGKRGRCVGQTTLPASCTDCLEIWEPQGMYVDSCFDKFNVLLTCVVICPYNKNKQDALFTFKLL